MSEYFIPFERILYNGGISKVLLRRDLIMGAEEVSENVVKLFLNPVGYSREVEIRVKGELFQILEKLNNAT